MLRLSITMAVLFIFNCFVLFAQDEDSVRFRFVGAETGFESQHTDAPEFDFIRGDVTYYYTGYSSDNLSLCFQKNYYGAKVELRSKNNKFGLFGGLRYTRIFTSLGKLSSWESNSEYFFFLNHTDDLSTEYLRIKEINEIDDYIAIPLEIRFFPFNPRLFRFFIKFGVELGLRVNTKSEVEFFNPIMNNRENEVLNKFDETAGFFSNIYFSTGWKLGKDHTPNVSLEFFIPSIVLTKNTSALVSPQIGSGAQINIQIPF